MRSASRIVTTTSRIRSLQFLGDMPTFSQHAVSDPRLQTVGCSQINFAAKNRFEIGLQGEQSLKGIENIFKTGTSGFGMD